MTRNTLDPRHIKIVTDKKEIIIADAPFDLTIKDICERLDNDELHIECYRIMDGPDNQRQWRDLDGVKMGHGGKKWNGIKNPIIIDKASSVFFYNKIQARFYAWIDMARHRRGKATIGDALKSKEMLTPKPRRKYERAQNLAGWVTAPASEPCVDCGKTINGTRRKNSKGGGQKFKPTSPVAFNTGREWHCGCTKVVTIVPPVRNKQVAETDQIRKLQDEIYQQGLKIKELESVPSAINLISDMEKSLRKSISATIGGEMSDAEVGLRYRILTELKEKYGM